MDNASPDKVGGYDRICILNKDDIRFQVGRKKKERNHGICSM